MTSVFQGYKDIYLPLTLECVQELVLMTFHSYSALPSRCGDAISHA